MATQAKNALNGVPVERQIEIERRPEPEAKPDRRRGRKPKKRSRERSRARKAAAEVEADELGAEEDRKSTRLNSSHANISYAVFCLKKKNGLPPTSTLRQHLCY